MAATAPRMCEVLDCSQLSAAPSKTRQKSVLLIEDSEDAMLLVKYALQEYGRGKYRLLWAKNLIQGLEQLGSGEIDVVLLDLGLPESSGAVTYAWVREIAPEVPAIVLTADDSEETEFSVLAGGAADYLHKALASGALLIEAIQAAMSASKARQQTGTAGQVVHRFRWKLA